MKVFQMRILVFLVAVFTANYAYADKREYRVLQSYINNLSEDDIARYLAVTIFLSVKDSVERIAKAEKIEDDLLRRIRLEKEHSIAITASRPLSTLIFAYQNDKDHYKKYSSCSRSTQRLAHTISQKHKELLERSDDWGSDRDYEALFQESYEECAQILGLSAD